MSFDLLVFDPAIVRYQDKAEFLAWYDEFTGWSGEHNYNDLQNASVPLQAWFHDIRVTYGPMNGPYAPPFDFNALEEPEEKTDYSIGREAIYVVFTWPDMRGGFEAATRLAAKHELGFFNVSSPDGDVWVPDGRGGMQRVF